MPVHAVRALRQDVERVLRAARHYVEHVANELVRHGLVEQVAHRVHEYAPRLLPMQRQVELVGMQHDVLGRVLRRPRLELRRPTRTPRVPFRQRLGIAVSAAWAHLGAAGDRIPCGLRPLDLALVTHAASVVLTTALHALCALSDRMRSIAKLSSFIAASSPPPGASGCTRLALTKYIASISSIGVSARTPSTSYGSRNAS